MGPYSLLPIGRHARELIEHAADHLGNNTEKDLTIALIHADNSIEIMLKEYLRFLKNKPWREIDNQGFIKLLDSSKDLKTVVNNRSQFVAFHDIRNALYHTGTFAPRKMDVESAIYFAQLLFNELHPKYPFTDLRFANPSLQTINSLAGEFGEKKPYVTEVRLITKLEHIFKKQGYSIKDTHKFAGTSIMADMLLTKNNEVIVVEVKARSKGKKVVNTAIFQLAGFVNAVRKELPLKNVNGWLITNTAFTKAAKTAANKLNIKLSTVDELENMSPERVYFY